MPEWAWRFYDGRDRLAVYVNSTSDVDDLIPTLTGYQIEWNKLHRLLNEELKQWKTPGA